MMRLMIVIGLAAVTLWASPSRLWEVVDSIPHPNDGGDGVFVDGDYIWCLKSVEQITQRWIEIYKINKTNGQVVRQFTYDGVKATDLVRIGPNLWISDYYSDPDRVIVLDTTNGSLIKEIQPSGGEPVGGLDWQPSAGVLYCSGKSGSSLEFYTMDTLGNVDKTYTGSGIAQQAPALGLAIDRTETNHLWVCDWTFFPPQRVVHKVLLDPSSNSYTIEETHEHPGKDYALPSGVGYDIQDGGYIFTTGGGGSPWIWKVKVAEIGVEEGLTNGVVDRLKVFPNPAASRLTIDLEIGHNIPVSLLICDVTGRTIKRFLDRESTRNRYHLRWNLRDDACRRVPAGVYFLMLKVQDRKQTRSLVIMR